MPRVLEDILQTPYQELFDPKYERLLYLGLRLNDKLEIERVRSPFLDVELKVDMNDLENPLMPYTEEVKTLADLGTQFETDDVGGIEVSRAEVKGDGANPVKEGTTFYILIS